jgi:cytochrome c oxidase subunit 3
MLFGGLFAGYIFQRFGAEPGYWPMHVLNVPVGTMNTAVLIFSSVTVVLAWAALKMRKFAEYRMWMAITIICGMIFLAVKLAYEWPEKFKHFGAILRKDALEKYEPHLGNQHVQAWNQRIEAGELHGKRHGEIRVAITGHLHELFYQWGTTPGDNLRMLDLLTGKVYKAKESHGHYAKDGEPIEAESHPHGHLTPSVIDTLRNKARGNRHTPTTTFKVLGYEIVPDPTNENPADEENFAVHFFPRKPNPEAKPIYVDAADVQSASNWVPKYNTYFACYFMITGLHGAHVLGGIIAFLYFFGPGASLYRRNPEQLANRVEVAGLFWHFVDLVWIFVFPIFYLL